MDSSVANSPAPTGLFPNESTTPADDGGGSSPSGKETSFFEKIRAVGQNVFTKHGIPFKKGRGRPRNDGAPGRGDVPLSTIPGPVPPVAEINSPDNLARLYQDLVKSCARSTSQATFSVLEGALRRAAIKKTGSKEMGMEIVAGAAVTEKEHDCLAEITPILLQKYGVDIRNLPEVCAVLTLGSIFTRFAFAFMELQKFDDKIIPMPEGKK